MPPQQQDDHPALRLDDAEIAVLIERGKDFLKNGDFASARLLLRRAADGGSADAAMALATTFDPVVLARLGAVGTTADIAKAREWYQRAVDLGSTAASQQLAKLAAE
jgi:TPR repeat protein